MSEKTAASQENERIHTAERRFLNALAAHLEGPTGDTWNELRASGEETSGMGVGVYGGMDWPRDLSYVVGPLLDQDKAIWARLLQGLLGEDSFALVRGAGARLKKLSPFADKLLVVEEVGPRRASYYGEMHEIIRRATKGAERVEVRAGRYLVMVDDTAVPAT